MTISDASDDRVLFEVDPESRIATITLNNPEQRNSYDASMRDSAGPVPGPGRRGRRSHGGAAARRGRGVQHRRRHEQRLRLVRRKRPEAGCTAAKSRPSQRRRLTVDRKSFGFYHNLMGFPEGHRRRDQRLRARRRFRDGADDGHLGDRPRHQDRHARHPLPRSGAGQPAHVLPSPRAGAGAAAAADRRHHRGRCRSSTWASSPRPAPRLGPGPGPVLGARRPRRCRPTAS